MAKTRPENLFVNPFGFNDSEKERDVLPELYLSDTGFNARAIDPSVSIIIGRRGSGKTALAQYFRFKGGYEFYVDIDEPAVFSHILEELCRKLQDHSHSVVDDISKMWELAFWTSLMSKMAFGEVQFDGDDRAKIVKYLRTVKVEDAEQPNVVRSLFLRLVGMVNEAAMSAIDLVLKVHDHLTSVEFTEARDSACRYLNASRGAVIVIDTLEQYEVRKLQMQQAMGAMLQAVTQFALGGMHPNVHIKCFLPAEIVPYLLDSSVQNIGKTFEFPVYLNWRPRDLLRLLCWRFVHYLKRSHPKIAIDLVNVDWDDKSEIRARVWEQFFPKTIRNRNGIQEDSLQYIVRHTQLHPRQLIWMCNEIARFAKQRRTFPQFHSRDVVDGIHSVENMIGNEVLSSYRNVYPNNKRILSCFQGQPNVFPRSSSIDKLLPRTKSAWPDEMPYDRMLAWQMIAEVGFIGQIVDQTDRYYEAEYEYTVGDRMALHYDEPCAIHPMFYSLFRVKADKSKVVYPMGPNISNTDSFRPNLR